MGEWGGLFTRKWGRDAEWPVGQKTEGLGYTVESEELERRVCEIL